MKQHMLLQLLLFSQLPSFTSHFLLSRKNVSFSKNGHAQLVPTDIERIHAYSDKALSIEIPTVYD